MKCKCGEKLVPTVYKNCKVKAQVGKHTLLFKHDISCLECKACGKRYFGGVEGQIVG